MASASIISRGFGALDFAMGRRSTNPIELLMIAISRAGLPAGLALAAVVFIILRWLSTREPIAVEFDEGFATALGWNTLVQAAPALQWAVPGLILLAAFAASYRRAFQLSLVKDVRRSSSSDLGKLGWRQFEELLAGHFRTLGFEVISNHGSGPDGGVDLRLRWNSELYLVQCKHWRARKVPVTTVRELFGVMASEGAVGGYVVTSGAFTSDAVAFAEGRNIELINGQELLAQIRAEVSEPSPALQRASERQPAPACPQCGSIMVLRLAKKGLRAGSEFWGCSRYPKCRGTRSESIQD